MKEPKNFPAPVPAESVALAEIRVVEPSTQVSCYIAGCSGEAHSGSLLSGIAGWLRHGARRQPPPRRQVQRQAAVRIAGKGRSLHLGLAGLLLSSALLALSPAMAEESGGWRERLNWPPRMELDHVLVQTSLHTTHFNPRPEHNNNQRLIGVELHNPELWFAGFARFKNSFSQDTHYLYVGRELPMWESGDTRVRAKLTAGALHGYRGEYRDKIPFNRYEIAPAILPTLGIRWKRVETDLMVFGTAGIMVTTGLYF